MKKKALLIIGSIGIIYFFVSYLLPNYIGVPLAAYESYKNRSEYEKENSGNRLNELVLDSIGDFPFPIGSVSDYEKVFSEGQILKLTEIISSYEQETTREIAIVSVSSIEPYIDIQKYSTDLANEWGIGKAETNNGLLILFSKNLQEISISTGLGTEKILTDEICKKVIDSTIIPQFKNGKYLAGIEKGMAELTKQWD
ncbi:TPM domain-containing protein [Maribacter sp. HTCC2170]|uniref:TPM domain-containing protein n=1 Tax=Maribacter sp. (strain HTCC2170 / KCCM 42371) TaxID=313603 RepID=UPI00006BE0CD|nr:TPM domain-containing protein [Maribacter sp. HTCC2170]EAR00013.1 hypothetical protein FB2170_01527 [Maribacter sp. HTCC2170]